MWYYIYITNKGDQMQQNVIKMFFSVFKIMVLIGAMVHLIY